VNGSVSSFYVAGGTLRHDAPCCVERQADQDLYEGLKAGAFCCVLTARQMGKSSLMVRTAARLRQEGFAVVVLDLTAIGQNLSVDQWYNGLLALMSPQLDLEEEAGGILERSCPSEPAATLDERPEGGRLANPGQGRRETDAGSRRPPGIQCPSLRIVGPLGHFLRRDRHRPKPAFLHRRILRRHP
jgi:hypothetical protein